MLRFSRQNMISFTATGTPAGGSPTHTRWQRRLPRFAHEVTPHAAFG
jgi:hypothetical protein